MSQRPNTKSIRRILLESLPVGVVAVVLQYAWWTFLFLHGYRGPDLVALVIAGLVYGVLMSLVTAAVLIVKSRHQA